MVSLIQDSSKLYGNRSHSDYHRCALSVSMPELSFELSIGDVIIILILVTLILIVLIIDRTRATIANAQLLQPQLPRAMKECPARFGFLHRLPRGGTIPEECYVCSQLVECLGFQRNPRT
jgi:hypothetical protein